MAAFRATLEEVLEANLVLHVRDISHPASDEQTSAVEEVLNELFDGEGWAEHSLEVRNKIDLLDEDCRPEEQSSDGHAYVSAHNGEGVDALLEHIDQQLDAQLTTVATLTIPTADGKAYAWLHAHGQVLEKRLEEDEYVMEMRMAEAKLAQFHQLFNV